MGEHAAAARSLARPARAGGRVIRAGITSGVLVDSSVLLDLFTSDAAWAAWSAARLAEAFDAGQVVINPIVYAEVSVAFDRIETLEDALPEQPGREDLPWEAAFLAGRCFVDYRRRGGSKRTPLPDFCMSNADQRR